MEAGPPVVAKKLWNIVRIVFFMLKTGISKSKIMVDLHFMLKKGKHNAGKAISNLVFHHKVHDHLSSLSCRSNDAHLSFISPREYEFSCSNSPAFYPFYAHKRKHHHHYNYYNNRHHSGKSSNYHYDDVTTVAAVQKVLEMLNNEAAAVEASPMVLPGFGRSPMVRQLRVTDSPFPLKDEGDSQVDKAAEEFIKKFYKDLKSQKRMSALESPAHNTWGR
ncbi:hypothetical protein QUC31_020148 [Theobroma cacao]|uniref:Uncharacterized protein LOC18588525 n=2 Tax=Theobroma cacao TaxID=3641 RepID=A0AB32UPW7_THECC|nr:PREDICTED: uncharacterized protein LOC18588525 [Theobroma cacao]EOY30674.1 Uncharacterized protein TCM_037801 [Theobroma cacao]WRX34926.1 Protein of unknown function DUF761 [Theobroma cacao]